MFPEEVSFLLTPLARQISRYWVYFTEENIQDLCHLYILPMPLSQASKVAQDYILLAMQQL